MYRTRRKEVVLLRSSMVRVGVGLSSKDIIPTREHAVLVEPADRGPVSISSLGL
jgi:hypothetical protein